MECKTSHIKLDKHLAAMLRKSELLIGLPIVEVTGHTQNAIDCRKTAHLKLEDFIKMSIGTDSCGQPAIRVKFIDTCDRLIDCTQKNDANPFRRMFAYDPTAKTYALVINKSS